MSKKVLLTGGAGFIGHHFVQHVLKNTDWEIVVIDKLTYASNGLEKLRDIGAMSSENKAFLDAYEGLTESAMKAEVKARVMSKLYSLTRSFKDAGYTEIKMPQKGKTKTQAKTSELAKLLGLKKSTK